MLCVFRTMTVGQCSPTPTPPFAHLPAVQGESVLGGAQPHFPLGPHGPSVPRVGLMEDPLPAGNLQGPVETCLSSRDQ